MDLATLAQTIIVYSVPSTSPSALSALIPMEYLPPILLTVSPAPIPTVSNVLTITPFALSVTISPISTLLFQCVSLLPTTTRYLIVPATV